MPAVVQTQEMQRLSLVAVSGNDPLAAGVLAVHLGLDRTDAVALLARCPSVLAEALPIEGAIRLAAMLSALGVAVRMDTSTGMPTPLPVAIALQPTLAPQLVAERLETVLGRPVDAVLRDLVTPGGLVLTMPADEAKALRRSLRREPGLRVIISQPETALYDLFVAQAHPAGLSTLLHRLGLGRCRSTGAIAAALDQHTAALVVERFGGAGVFALNRDFQRFDLFVTGAGGVPPAQVADFLATRCPQPRARLQALSSATPVQIESGLTHAAARQFEADYAAIGLDTCLRLSRPVA